MAEYTPTPTEVREAWVRHIDGSYNPEREAEFDRMLEQVRAEARLKAASNSENEWRVLGWRGKWLEMDEDTARAYSKRMRELFPDEQFSGRLEKRVVSYGPWVEVTP